MFLTDVTKSKKILVFWPVDYNYGTLSMAGLEAKCTVHTVAVTRQLCELN